MQDQLRGGRRAWKPRTCSNLATGKPCSCCSLRSGGRQRTGSLGSLSHGTAPPLLLVEPPPSVQGLSNCGAARLRLHQANHDETSDTFEKSTGTFAPVASKRQVLVSEKRSSHWRDTRWSWGLSISHSAQVRVTVIGSQRAFTIRAFHSAGPGYSATVGGVGQKVLVH